MICCWTLNGARLPFFQEKHWPHIDFKRETAFPQFMQGQKRRPSSFGIVDSSVKAGNAGMENETLEPETSQVEAGRIPTEGDSNAAASMMPWSRGEIIKKQNRNWMLDHSMNR